MPRAKILVTVLLSFLVIGGVSIVKVLRTPGTIEGPLSGPGDRAHTRLLGDPAAPVRVVAFTDFQCPACAQAAEVVKILFVRLPGVFSFEFRYYPFPMHFFSRRASVYAECMAAQKLFWPFHDVLFRSQMSWGRMEVVDPYFTDLAVSLGADGVALKACVNSGVPEKAIDQDLGEGRVRGVRATPTFFVNGKMVVGVHDLEREIRRARGEDFL
ncbi:MAG: thioredoxin domain-containing protein [Elusimicrobia bacterium]|nr:thioredoxin domain-containing protein [Elusimicrobiota bacterium]